MKENPIRQDALKRAKEINKNEGLNTFLDHGYREIQIENTQKLIKTIIKLDKQNQKLEKASFALQWTAMILGLIAVFFGSSQLLLNLFNISSYVNFLISVFITFIIAIFLESRVKKIVRG